MQVGHKTAYPRQGGTTLRNSVALFYGCNKKQGTDSWEVFQKKQGKRVAVDNLKSMLSKLSMKELKYIATKHGIKLKGRYVEGGGNSGRRLLPSALEATLRQGTSK